MRQIKIFGNIFKWLKSFFNRLFIDNSYDLKSLEEKINKTEDTVSSVQNTIGVVAKFSSIQILKQSKNEEIHNGILKVLAQHEEEVEGFKNLLNQHADVINTLRKHVYKDSFQESSKKELDENSNNNNILNINKKINKDN